MSERAPRSTLLKSALCLLLLLAPGAARAQTGAPPAEGPPPQTALYELSKLTGGWTSFLEEPPQAAGICSAIFSDVGNRYAVGFYPTNKGRDGKRRRVQVEVRGHPEYTVWGRKSYYAPGS